MKKFYLLSILFLSSFSYSRNIDLLPGSSTNNNLKSLSLIKDTLVELYPSSELNYEANATVADPTTSPTASSTSICEGSTLTLTANPSGGLAPYTYSWTGPNSYTSTAENPVLNNITLANAGTYSLIITDSLGAISVSQSTTAITVNQKIDPTFDALLPAICSGSNAPILSNLSSNGITGTWNPATVSNLATGTYVFTPNAGECANPLSLTIFVINNVTPVFTLPATICVGATAPNLASTSNNGIPGTWNPSTVSNTTSGSYVFTPSPGQCALVYTKTITINPIVTPTFNAIPAICGNASAPILPTTSTNGITGTWDSAVSNTASGTYTFTPDPGQCATTATISVVVNPNITPTFTAIGPICSGATAPVLPTTANNSITGSWSPATISNTVSGTYTFTPTSGQCALTTTLTVTVNPNSIPTFDTIDPICYGSKEPLLPTTSNNGINGSWSPAIISNTTSGSYTFTPNTGLCATPITINVVVNTITPSFNFISPICANATASILPTTSVNAITGIWNPAIVSNTASGTYTFTPDANQCAKIVSINIVVAPNILPTFNPIADVCYGTPVPDFQSTSNNGFTGIWSPATISNTTSGTYTFTPTAGQCATTATVNINVNTITPSFTAIPAFCENSTAPTLPTTSNNGIIGTWNPATINNTSSATYTFTPNANQCALPATLNSTVTPNTTPTFTTIAPICSGASSPILATTSNNGYTGTWSPATISNTASATYTFTPTAGQCASPTTLNVTVNPNSIPTFDPIDPICYGSTVPALPSTSNNGISGSWSPAILNNTTPGTYTFTPDSGLCATPITITTVINTITPTFTAIAPICENALAPSLQSPSINGISGIWSPATVSNTASGTYTFTPDANQCAPIVSINIIVNPITATFTPVADICSGSTLSALPTTSTNGVIGSWTPALNNTLTTTYEFTPDAGQCATTKIALTINVIPNVLPTFTALAPICSSATSPVLPTTSINGITGSWSPSTVSNSASATYTFNPSVGLCALTTTLNVTVLQSPTAILTTITDVINEDPFGVIEINSITSGLAPFQYSINNSGFTSELIYRDLLSGNYTITVRDSNGCEFSKVVTINSICFFPNAISPNNDALNDTFNLKGCNIVKLELFNRYGRKVNTFNNYSDQWAGTNHKGEALPDGTYYYVAEDNNGKVNSGWIYIVR